MGWMGWMGGDSLLDTHTHIHTPSISLVLQVIKTVIQASKGKKKKEKKQQAGDEEEGAGSSSTEEEEEEEQEAAPLTSRQVAEEIYARGGLKAFFEGVQYASLQSALEKSIYFYAYSMMRGIVRLLNGGQFGVRENLIVGYVSEIIHLPVTGPSSQPPTYSFCTQPQNQQSSKRLTHPPTHPSSPGSNHHQDHHLARPNLLLGPSPPRNSGKRRPKRTLQRPLRLRRALPQTRHSIHCL